MEDTFVATNVWTHVNLTTKWNIE